MAERSSAGTAGAGVNATTGWWVKVTESMADRAAPAVVQPRLVRLLVIHGEPPDGSWGTMPRHWRWCPHLLGLAASCDEPQETVNRRNAV